MRRSLPVAEHGFTLVETLVALAALAFISIAAMAMTASSARFAASERERAVAAIVADNLVVEALARSALPELGDSERLVEAGGRRWRARLTSQEAGERLRSVEVSVFTEDGERVVASARTLRSIE